MADVFISYAREDQGFVRRLNDALALQGRESWVDWEGIPPSALWMEEVRRAIDSAEAVVFVVSPASVESLVCREEVELAAAANKRLVPVVCQEVEGHAVPPAVAARNWIFLRNDDEFEEGVAKLLKAIDTDQDWVRAHTRLLLRAREWEQRNRPRSLSLRGDDLKEAEAWLAAAAGREPEPTVLQTAFVLAARKTATARLRLVFGAVAIGLVISLVLSAVALAQRNAAHRNEARAERQQAIAERRAAESRSRELGALSLTRASDDPELALLLATGAAEVAETETAEIALRAALAASHIEDTLQENGSVSALAMSADGSTLVTGGGLQGEGNAASDWLTLRAAHDLDQVRSLDSAVPAPFWGIKGPQGVYLADLAVDARGRFVAASTNLATVLIIDVVSGSTRRVTDLPFVVERAELAFSPDGRRVLVAGEEGIAWLETVTRRTSTPLPTPVSGDAWTDVAIDPTGTRAALSSQSGVYVMDLSMGRGRLSKLSGIGASSLSFDASGRRLAAGLADSTVVWQAPTGTVIQRVRGSRVATVALSSDGSALLTGSEDGQATIWDVATGSPVASLIGHQDAVVGAAFEPSGARVFTAGQDGTTRSWRVPAPARPITSDPVLALSGDGRLIGTHQRGIVTFRDGASGEEVFTLAPGDLESVTDGCSDPSPEASPRVRISGDGALAVAVFGERCLVAVDLRQGEPLWSDEVDVIPGEFVGPYVWISSDGQAVLVAVWPGDTHVPELRLLDAATGDEVWSEITGTSLVYEAAFSTDGEQMLLAGRYGSTGTALYSTDDRKTVCTSEAPGEVTDVTAVPGGGFALATDVGAQIFDDQCIATDVGELSGRRSPLLGIAYRSDGAVVATAEGDGTVRLWDGSSGSQLGAVLGSEEHLAFTEGGDLLMGGASGAHRYVCDVCGSFEELLTLARDRATRSYTEEERATYGL